MSAQEWMLSEGRNYYKTTRNIDCKYSLSLCPLMFWWECCSEVYKLPNFWHITEIMDKLGNYGQLEVSKRKQITEGFRRAKLVQEIRQG